MEKGRGRSYVRQSVCGDFLVRHDKLWFVDGLVRGWMRGSRW